MLSRIAESLFWIGRYVERSEHTARILQLAERQAVEDPTVGAPTVAANILALMGVPAPTYEPLLHEAGPEAAGDVVTRLLAYDRYAPTSIIFCWQQARDNARRAREVVPASVWEAINTTWQQMPEAPLTGLASHDFLDHARQRSALLYGLARGSMVRDEGWQFLQMGRSLEQADMTARLVTATTFEVGAVSWPAVLRGSEAQDAFLRTYRGWGAEAQALDFLVQDTLFPRSVMHGLDRALQALGAVAPSTGVGRPGQARYELGKLVTGLAYTPTEELARDLAETMAQVQRACQVVTAAIAQEFFATAVELAWTTEESG